MAARGSASKEKIMEKILATFEGSFKYDKEIRIPCEENGETVQIKVTFTAAKVNVSNGEDEMTPTPVSTKGARSVTCVLDEVMPSPVSAEPSLEEKQRLEKLIAETF